MKTLTPETEPLHESADPAFIGRLRQLVDLAGNASALARRAGISQSGLSRYLGGGDPSRKVLLALAQATQTSVEWLASGVGSMQAQEGQGWGTLRKLPLLPMGAVPDVVSPVEGTDFSAQAFCFRWLSKNGLDISNLIAMEVRGDSMAPTLRAGAVLLIDLSQTSVEDDGIYLLRDSDVTLLRRLQLEVGSLVRVLADNPSHREFTVPAKEIHLLGKVVWGSFFL